MDPMSLDSPAADRRLPLLDEVKTAFLTDDEFQAQVVAGLDEDLDQAEMQQSEQVWQALGLINPDLDLYGAVLQLFGEAVLGYYDPEVDELVMRGVDGPIAVPVPPTDQGATAVDSGVFGATGLLEALLESDPGVAFAAAEARAVTPTSCG